MAPFIFYLLANAPQLTAEDQGPWTWVALFRDCTSGDTLTQDLNEEFGNRQRGAAAVASTRQTFLTWAATQPATLTLYMPVKLGQWDSASGVFSIDSQVRYAFATREGAVASESGGAQQFPGLFVDTDGTNSGSFSLDKLSLQAESAVCPAQDGGMFWAGSNVRWAVQFGEPTTGVALPAIRMTSDQAQAFVAHNAERRVLYEITFATAPSASISQANSASGALVEESGRIVNVRVTDYSGGVLIP